MSRINRRTEPQPDDDSSNAPNRLRAVVLVVATFVLLAAVAPFVFFAVPQVIGADDGFVVLSGSMEPSISPGDVVIVDAGASIESGDVITYGRSADSVPTTHRVVGVVDGGYETKGDANENVDAGVVSRDDVVGQVVLVIPFIGHVILWANTPMGFVALVVIPLVLLGANELWRYARPSPTTATEARGDEHPVDADTVPAGAAATGGDHTGVRAGELTQATPVDGIDAVPGERTDAVGIESAAVTAAAVPGRDDDLPSVFAPSETDTLPDDGPGHVEPTVGVGVLDMKLTMLAMGVVLTYAVWNVWRELAAFEAPSPISVGVLTGSLLGLSFATWVTVAAWRQNRHVVESHTADEPTGHLTDGGADMETDHE